MQGKELRRPLNLGVETIEKEIYRVALVYCR